MSLKLSALRDKLLSKAKLHEFMIHSFYLILVAGIVIGLEISMHHLNEEMFLAWVCADVRGAIAFMLPANDHKIAVIRKIRNEKKKHVMIVIKEFITVMFIAVVSFTITEWFLGSHVEGVLWWTMDILIIMLLWVIHYYMIEFMVSRFQDKADGLAVKE